MPLGNRILVTLDGSALAEHALPYALAWAGRVDSPEIVLARVTEPTPGMMTSMLEHCQSYLEGMAAAVRQQGVPCRTVSRQGPVADSLVAVVAAEEPALLVMTTHGLSGGKRFLLGSVAQGVMRRATCPVLLIRGVGSQLTDRPVLSSLPVLEPVLAPVDGSPDSLRALDYCAAHPFLARGLRVLRATDRRGGFDPNDLFSPGWREQMASGIQARMQELESLYGEGLPGLAVEVREGEAAEAILHSVRSHDCRLIVMTTAGRSGLDLLLLGSVAEKVLHRADCPLLMLPPGVRVADRDHTRSRVETLP